MKRELVEHAAEERFSREADQVLGFQKSQSMPNLKGICCPGEGGVPKATSRPVLEPTEWSPVRLQGLACGRFSQVVELGPWARLGTRGGPTCDFCPCEFDGAPAAGKRTVRTGPSSVAHNDMGILHGNASGGIRGQAAGYKTWHGASSGAPAQDHYTFQRGSAITDVEFPLGKRMFARWP
jgi:hypothetical protein